MNALLLLLEPTTWWGLGGLFIGAAVPTAGAIGIHRHHRCELIKMRDGYEDEISDVYNRSGIARLETDNAVAAAEALAAERDAIRTERDDAAARADMYRAELARMRTARQQDAPTDVIPGAIPLTRSDAAVLDALETAGDEEPSC